MSDYAISVWTHSCMVLAGAGFPWYLISYEGRCSRVIKNGGEGGIRANVSLPGGLKLVTRVMNVLQHEKDDKVRSVFDVLRGQPSGYDLKFDKILASWLDGSNKPHQTVLRRITHKKMRTVEADYEAGVADALARVRGTAIRLGIRPPFLTDSYLVMESLDGHPVGTYDEDDLYRLIGTQLYSSNPLSRVLYDVVEQTVTRRGVREIRVLPGRDWNDLTEPEPIG